MKGSIGIGIAIGTMIGASVTYIFTSRKYEKKVKEAEEAHSKTLCDLADAEISLRRIRASMDVSCDQEDEKYTAPTEHTPAFKSVENDISIIAFDDFETIPEYDSEVLFYYPNTGDILDDQYNPIGKQKLREMIGDDAIHHFDEYDEDPDCVRIRNDTLKTYYELLRQYTSP